MDAFLVGLGVNPQDYRVSRDRYAAISSNRQFAAFRGKHKFYLDLLVYSFTKKAAPPKPAADDAVYASLKQFMRKTPDMSYPAKIAAPILQHYVKAHADRVERYLDLGCGQCLITKELASLLGVTGFGADVESEFERSWEARPTDIEFAHISAANPLGHSGKWDLITAIMVMHHIPDPAATAAAIVAALNEGGVLILKEHDCFTDVEAMLVDIEHCLYIVQNNDDWRGKVRDQYIRCRNWIEWAYMFRDLELLHHGPWGYPAESFGLTRKSVLVFRKPPAS